MAFSLSLLIASVLLPLVSSSPFSANTLAACKALAASHADSTVYNPLNPATLLQGPAFLSALNASYSDSQSHYWSSANADLQPACIFFPRCTVDVQNAVKILNSYSDVQFAVKAGGHNTNVGFSSVDGGVLISFRPFMAYTVVSADGNTADVKPGARWGEAVNTLQPIGKAVTGGRLSDVGVGGYILGGGLSFLSGEVGLACDTVEAFEIVFANATVATVTRSSNKDLFTALRGGGNQFGIVTNFKMRTLPVKNVWGGSRVYSADKAQALVNATVHFTQNYKDTRAAIISTFEVIPVLGLTPFIFFFYDGPVVPAGIFDEFNSIAAEVDNTKYQNYGDLLVSNNMGGAYGPRYLFRALTLPSFAGNDGVALSQYHFQNWVADATAKINKGNTSTALLGITFQPLPQAVQAASEKAGGNAYGMAAANGDRIWMEYTLGWTSKSDDAFIQATAQNFTSYMIPYTQKTYPNRKSAKQTNSASSFAPTFANDAGADQPVLQSFGTAQYAKLKALQRNLDPRGFFNTRTGGFKYT